MRKFSLLAAFLFVVSAVSVPGCGSSSEPTMEDRSEEEIQAIEAEIYGAEEEDAADSEEE